MSYYIVDVESDGPIPGKYSMVCFGAIKVTDKLDKTFYGETKPMSDKYIPEALAISGFSREQHQKFPEPVETMCNFYEWIMSTSVKSPIFVSDNPAYDWQFINYYFHMYSPQGKNPFGYSGRRVGDLYCGLVGDARAPWKHLRKTKHTHNPIDDARGDAEVMLYMQQNGLKIEFK